MKKTYAVLLGGLLGGMMFFGGFYFYLTYLFPNPDCDQSLECVIFLFIIWAICVIVGAAIGSFAGLGWWRRKDKS